MDRTYTIEDTGQRGEPLDEPCTLCRPGDDDRLRRASSTVKVSTVHTTSGGVSLTLVLWMCAKHWAAAIADTVTQGGTATWRL